MLKLKWVWFAFLFNFPSVYLNTWRVSHFFFFFFLTNKMFPEIFSDNFFQFDQDLFRGLRYTTRATKLGRRLYHVTSLVLLRQGYNGLAHFGLYLSSVTWWLEKIWWSKTLGGKTEDPTCVAEKITWVTCMLIVLVVKPVSKWINCWCILKLKICKYAFCVTNKI